MEGIFKSEELKQIESIYDYNQLNKIRDLIEKMTKINQISILRILNNTSNVTINENKYGIHINLSDISDDVIKELIIYINYVNDQEVELNDNEQKKEDYKNIFFIKDNKDNMINQNNNITNEPNNYAEC